MSSSERRAEQLMYLFLLVWYLIAHNTHLNANEAFGATAFLFAVVGLVIWYFRSAAFRDASDARKKLWTYFGCWCLGFAVLAPMDLFEKLMALASIGPALLVAGAAARRLHDGNPDWPIWKSHDWRWWRWGAASFLVLMTFAFYSDSAPLLGVVKAVFACGLEAVALYYGWHFGVAPQRPDRDARLGSPESYRDAGISDER